MNDTPSPAPVPPDSPALRAAQQALEEALADEALEGDPPADPADPADPGDPAESAGPADRGTGSVDPDADLAERARRLAQAQQALAALLDSEPPGSPPPDDAEA